MKLGDGGVERHESYTNDVTFTPQSETAKVANDENELEDSVESEDREGLDHDLEDEMWS